MCYARVAAGQINAYCALKFPQKPEDKRKMGSGMASTWTNGSVIDSYDHTGYGTHKYIAADEFTRQLGEPEGAGVYAYWGMKDGSLLLLTCRGPLAWAPPYVDGVERIAQWGEFSGMEA